MGKFKLNLVVFLTVTILFSLPTFSQNFDYELQNSLTRVYLNPDINQEEDFNIFRKTFFAEGNSSFNYLYGILDKNNEIKQRYSPFFYKVDTRQFEIYKTTVDKMVKDRKFVSAWVFSIDTLINYLSNVSNFLPFVLNCMSKTYLVIFYFILILGVISFLRFFRLLLYDVRKLLEKKGWDNSLALYIAFFVVVFLPVFFTIHLKFLPVYWLLLFFIYSTKKEKVITYFAIALLMIVSFIGVYLTSFTKNVYKNKTFYYESLVEPFSGISKDKKTRSNFENFVKAVSLLRQGNSVDSIKVFKEIDSDSNLYKYALNNIGVAYIFLSRPKLALNFFDEAVKNGLNFEPNINKFYLNSKLYNIVESEEALKSAYSSNPLKTSLWLRLNIKEPFPQISVPSFNEILFLFLKEFSFSKSVHSLKIIVFLLCLLIFLIIIHFFSKDISVTKGCIKCGTPFKVFESQNDKLCTQCALLSKNKGDISSDLKEIKRREVRLYLTIKRFFEVGLGLIFPGFYNIFVLQKVFSGFFIFLVFFVLLLDSLNAYKITHNFYVTAPLFAMVLMVYLINLINVFFERGEDSWL
ncbi:hypothetical protein TTHT_0785 [Thermotomaculum hydrothermale]|uniref:Tetratricopeptide repeat protein n=1 Tax=Thermotomaculum hydrothermale TaxID=981385 RepID=A0A7R6PQ87_9BACT|nr:hypothetical protein [Thermotomaculum hydrothermale]BBB32351.1 hypothetical protein TTHT_0785 [Thermotomaculum hydrothermale]